MKVTKAVNPKTTTMVKMELSESELYKLLAGETIGYPSTDYRVEEEIAEARNFGVWVEIKKQDK